MVVPLMGKMTYTQKILNTHEPSITIMVGTMVLLRPRAAAMVQSIKAESAYEKHIIASLSLPAAITASLPVKMDRNI